ncbi:hypothetical protein AMJ82_04890 [candidate division TA06 bacterium SM23_40]|uniref:Carbohydrate-binding/sugar hydrolysis domain-containing protein n=2 Tax=Bacteria division TA06 TaxID=1156500 RepID=A0A0S8G9H7_UNCT6|nr:MAG: hypothetical protein AMJ82_04890 [candidate division TA06 bacterium SM23_40]
MKRAVILVGTCMTLRLCFSVSATILRVPSEYPTVQAGIYAAGTGDTVLVADGIYTGEGNRDIDFLGKSIIVTSQNGPQATAIDCQGSGSDWHRGFHFRSGETSASVLHGFQIINGWVPEGGAVRCDQASPTIVGNTFTGNTATRGGAVYCCNEASPVINGNMIVANGAGWGGGVYCDDGSPTIRNNTITWNIAHLNHGGGIYSCNHSSPLIQQNAITANTASGDGGGVHCSESSPTIEGNTISDNSAGNGGGIYCTMQSSAPIMANAITSNWADSSGAGICCISSSPTIERNTIVGNNGYRGAGIDCHDHSSPLIHGNTMTGNAASWGAAIECREYSYPTVSHNAIAENVAYNCGGGIMCRSYASPTVIWNTIIENHAGDRGGGMYCELSSSVILDDNTVALNVGAYRGGGICCYSGSSALVRYTTLTGNAAEEGGAIYCAGSGSSVTLANSIVWADSPSEIEVGYGGSVAVTYSDVQGGWPGEGNIDADPLFVVGFGSDYFLSQIAAGQSQQSPCVDTGDPTSALPQGTTRTDHRWDFWPVDMGYHYPSVLSIRAIPDTHQVHRGEELWFTVDMVNVTDSTLTFDAWADAYLPTSNPYAANPVLGVVELSLGGGCGFNGVRRSVRIPVQAPYGGPYALCVRAGVHADSVSAEACFVFDILPPSRE